MQLNPDLIRRITIETEKLTGGKVLDGIDGVSLEDFLAHVEWMRDAALIEVNIQKHLEGPPLALVFRLTWEGCNFLDSVRADSL